MQTENAEELELCLQYCWVGFIHAFSLSVCAALCHNNYETVFIPSK